MVCWVCLCGEIGDLRLCQKALDVYTDPVSRALNHESLFSTRLEPWPCRSSEKFYIAIQIPTLAPTTRIFNDGVLRFSEALHIWPSQDLISLDPRQSSAILSSSLTGARRLIAHLGQALLCLYEGYFVSDPKEGRHSIKETTSPVNSGDNSARFGMSFSSFPHRMASLE